jgi:hypothetical protein
MRGTRHDGRTKGWMDEQTDGRMDDMDEWMDRWMDTDMDDGHGWIDGHGYG